MYFTVVLYCIILEVEPFAFFFIRFGQMSFPGLESMIPRMKQQFPDQETIWLTRSWHGG